MATTEQNIQAVRNLLGAAGGILEQVEQMRGMFDDSDGNINSAVEELEEWMEKARKAIDALESHRPAALVIVEGGNIQNILTTGGVDVMRVEYQDGDEPLDNPVEVRVLQEDGTWSESDTAEVSLYGEHRPSPQEVAIVEARIREFKRTDGHRC